MTNPDPVANACTRCGTFLKGVSDLFYSEAGDRICQNCFERGDLEAGAVRYARKMRNAGYAAPVLAVGAILLSTFLGVFGLIFMAAAALSSGGLLVAIARDGELRSRIGPHLVPVCVCAGLGTAISGGCLGLVLLGLGVAVAR